MSRPLTPVEIQQTPMPLPVLVGHWIMMFLTAGLWYPVYAAGHRRRRVVVRRFASTTWQVGPW